MILFQQDMDVECGNLSSTEVLDQQDTDVCVCCSVSTKATFYIIDKNGGTGPCYTDACPFFSLEFRNSCNKRAFFCQYCSRVLKRIFRLREDEKELTKDFQNKTSSNLRSSPTKRNLDWSPDKRTYAI